LHERAAETWERASRAKLEPQKLKDTMAFMFESRYAIRLTRYALESSEGWQGLEKHFRKPPS